VHVGEHTWEAAGTLPLHELAELAGEPLQECGIATVSGWVTHRLGGFPKEGDVVSVGTCELRVEAMDGMRVARLKITRRVVQDAAGGAGAGI
jgi:CBS domain containing-hemolysin-like protein